VNRSRARWPVLAAVSCMLLGCGPHGEPRGPVDEPVDLFWYSQSGSDDFLRLPGFRTMEDCAQAGHSMSRLITAERESSCEIAASIAGNEDFDCGQVVQVRDPWFECGVRCRAWESNPKMALCKTTKEFR
jgi:hypothetical protein